MAERAAHDADGEAFDAERVGQHQRGGDDREVVHDGRDGGRGESAGRVEDARRDRSEGEEDGAEEHQPCQLDGSVALDGVGKPWRDGRDDDRSEDEQQHGQDEQPNQHEVRHGRHHPPGPRLLAGGEESGDDRDERRSERARRDELEDQVRDPERGEEAVELGAGGKRVRDDDQPNPAEDARREKRRRHDQPGMGEPSPDGHASWSAAVSTGSDLRARGWASR